MNIRWLAAVGAAVLAGTCPATGSGTHTVVIDGQVGTPGDGLLLGNGDLSCSIYQDKDVLVFRFGKTDVWDRRFYRNGDGQDMEPAHIEEYRRGVLEEGWKGSYDTAISSAKPPKDPKRFNQILTSVATYRYPLPVSKPVGEFRLRVPSPAYMGAAAKVTQTLFVEEARAEVVYAYPNGVSTVVEAVIDPEDNVLSVDWRILGWNDWTAYGSAWTQPVSGYIWRWQDPKPYDYYARERFESGATGVWTTRGTEKQNWNDVEALPAPVAKVLSDRRGTVEQAFYPDKWYPDGFKCRLTMDVAKDSKMAIPLAKEVKDAAVWFKPYTNKLAGVVQVTVTTSNDKSLEAPRPKSHTDTVAAARKAGADYWAKSGFSLPDDPDFEGLWYSVYHARRAIIRERAVPPGLFFPSTIGDYSDWHNDFHLNYNMQNIYRGDFAANRPEQAKSFFASIDYMVPMGRRIARDYYGCRGIYVHLSGYPIPDERDIYGHLPIGRMTYMTGWVAGKYWEYYQFTRDREWLKGYGYPMIRDFALFNLDFLRKAPSKDLPPNLDDGLYHMFPSVSGEGHLTGDPMHVCDSHEVVAHTRHCLYVAIEASKALGVDEELRAQWQDRLDHLAKTDHTLTGYRKHAYFCYPPDGAESGYGIPYRKPDFDWKGPAREAPGMAKDGGFYRYCGHEWGWKYAAVDKSDFNPNRDYPFWRRFMLKWRRPNGIVHAMLSPVGWTESLSCMAPVQEMLMQSWDGAIRLFPFWPRGCNAAFRDWRAQGAFLVSAEMKGGRIGDVTVRSEKGEDCLVWDDWTVTDADGKAVATDRDEYGRLRFRTTVGDVYRLKGKAAGKE